MTEKSEFSLEKKWWIMGLGVPFFVWADLYTKELVVRHMHLGRRIPIIEGFFNLYYTRNTGAAFGMFADMDPAISRYFFYGVSLLAFVILGFLFWSIPKHRQGLLGSTVMLILAGAIGNFADRVRLGYVIDFLDFHVGDNHWPTFNVADICISVGVVLLVVYSLIFEPRERREAEKKSGAQPANAA